MINYSTPTQLRSLCITARSLYEDAVPGRSVWLRTQLGGMRRGGEGAYRMGLKKAGDGAHRRAHPFNNPPLRKLSQRPSLG